MAIPEACRLITLGYFELLWQFLNTNLSLVGSIVAILAWATRHGGVFGKVIVTLFTFWLLLVVGAYASDNLGALVQCVQQIGGCVGRLCLK